MWRLPRLLAAREGTFPPQAEPALPDEKQAENEREQCEAFREVVVPEVDEERRDRDDARREPGDERERGRSALHRPAERRFGTRRPRTTEGLWPSTDSTGPMATDRRDEIAATFERIRRPLQWPMENFRRTRIANHGFVGYRFSRVRRNARAGFTFGFVLRDDVLPSVKNPPEVVAYAFVRPPNGTLHKSIAGRPNSAVRRLVASSRKMGFPFEFHPDGEVVAIRHRSVRTVPREIFVLVASDFLMLSYQPLRSSGFLERLRKATTRPGP